MKNYQNYRIENIVQKSNINYENEPIKKDLFVLVNPESSNCQITQYTCITNPIVQRIVSIDEILNTIRKGNEKLFFIEKARAMGKKTPEYDKIKTYKLPTYRFNFLFNKSANNENITEPTGLIYLDADEIEEIPDNEFVFAKWKSLSNKGFGILVKVGNLTPENHQDVYNQLSEKIGIKTDKRARKATQQTVLSYDPLLYHSTNSKTYYYVENKEKVSFKSILKKEKEGIEVDDTFFDECSDRIRFNNIDEYFKDDTQSHYKVFKEKVKICSVYIRQTYYEGNRNTVMFSLLSQLAYLNRSKGDDFLLAIGWTINYKMCPRLLEFELKTIVRNVIKKRNEGTLEKYYNLERRILFNPILNLSNKEKMEIVGKEMGNLKKEKTRFTINRILENWNRDIDGKITQKKVAEKSNFSIITIKRYWDEFKDYINCLEN